MSSSSIIYDANAITTAYTNRVQSGRYDHIAQRLNDMGHEALANIDYPDHFQRKVEEWSTNYTFVGNDKKELRVNVVGEIGSSALGTVLRANGTYYANRTSVCFSFSFLRTNDNLAT